MHIACKKGDMKMCQILNSFNCNWESLDGESQTPLFSAIESNDFEIVKFLVCD